MGWVVVAGFPVATLLAMQISSLRYQSNALTRTQAVCVAGQVRSLLDKRVGAAVTVALVTGALRAVKSLSISSRIAFS
jgi:hypothetical protein